MKAHFNKIIQVKTAIAYLVFEKEQERKDIQNFLNGKEFDDEIINERVKEYLRNLRILDENNIPTQKGERIKRTGKMFVREEGKYKIWFCEKDSFLKIKILYFQRIAPQQNSRVDILDINFVEDNYLLPTNANEFTELKLIINNKAAGQLNSGNETINFSWKWENLEKSFFIFDGQLGKNENAIKLEPSSIPCNEDLKSRIEEILPDWDKNYERLKIRYNEISNQSKISFEDNLEKKWMDFQVQFQEVPLMPYNNEDAKKWRNWLLTESLRKEYLNTSDFESSVIETNEKDAFKPYSDSLDVPELVQFSSLLKKDTLAFWHLNAPFDLNPNTKTKLPAKPIELKKDTKISFNEIAKKLNFEDLGEAITIVYYDRYVVNQIQQKAVVAFLQAIDSTTKIIITDLSSKENSSDHIQKNVTEIKLINCNTLFKSRFLPHDRYIIAANKDKIQIWNISNSIDYITFPDKNIDKNTLGTIRQSVVFTPVSREMLDKDLWNFIENKIKNEK